MLVQRELGSDHSTRCRPRGTGKPWAGRLSVLLLGRAGRGRPARMQARPNVALPTARAGGLADLKPPRRAPSPRASNSRWGGASPRSGNPPSCRHPRPGARTLTVPKELSRYGGRGGQVVTPSTRPCATAREG